MNFEIGPTALEAVARLVGRYINCVLINAVDLRQRFNKVDGVAFVASKLRSNRMSIDCDPQSVSPVIAPCRTSGTGSAAIYLLLPATEAWLSSP